MNSFSDEASLRGVAHHSAAKPLLAADAYEGLVAVLAVLLFDTGFTTYIFEGRHIGITPIAWLLILATLALPIALSLGRTERVVRSSIPAWCGVYFTWTCVTYLWSSQSLVVAKELRARTLVCITLPLFALVFSSPIAIRAARRAVVLCVLLSVALNCYDLVHPLTFSTVFGRSAGMFMNPNISATAIVAGMIIGLTAVPRRLRGWFVTIAGGGILLTLSRGLLLCYVVALTYFIATGAFRVRQLIFAALSSGVVLASALLFAVGMGRLAGAARIIAKSNVVERITDPSVALGGADFSANSRSADARMGWQVFEEHPLLGGGVGSTIDWDRPESTHNIYLRDIAEYGILGVALYPALLMLLAAGVSGASRNSLRAFAFVLALAGVFSHNVLDEWDVLLTMALAGMIAVDARRQVEGAAS
jgi:O-antigen ligase